MQIVILPISLLFCFMGHSLWGQCLVNPFIPLPSPAEELGLLPDTPSYYIEKEIYTRDTLRGTKTEMTFHNYGHRRIAVYNNEYTKDYAESITILQQLMATAAMLLARVCLRKL